MAARAIWKGIIRLGEVSVPVKLYGAVAEKTIHFRLLHKKDQIPVRQEMVHPDTGEVVPAEAVCHGYETKEGEIVILTDEELKSLEPKKSREIGLLRDRHRRRLLDLVRRKLKAGRDVVERPRGAEVEGAEIIDLMAIIKKRFRREAA